MDFAFMQNEELLDTLATLAVRANETDLDLISSGKRLGELIAKCLDEIVLRMQGDEETNRKKLLSFMQNAIGVNSDTPEEPFANFLSERRELLAISVR